MPKPADQQRREPQTQCQLANEDRRCPHVCKATAQKRVPDEQPDEGVAKAGGRETGDSDQEDTRRTSQRDQSEVQADRERRAPDGSAADRDRGAQKWPGPLRDLRARVRTCFLISWRTCSYEGEFDLLRVGQSVSFVQRGGGYSSPSVSH